jgi:hypothetical protein
VREKDTVITSPKYRVRFRFRLQKKLHIEQKEYRFEIEGRDVVLSPQIPDLNISDSEWLVMNVRGFESEEQAQAFGRTLKSACELSSIAARLGMDSGIDLPTAGLGQSMRDQIREQSGFLVRDNIHGVDVFLDDPAIRILNLNATGTVRATHHRFLGDLKGLFEALPSISQKTKDTALLLNYALLRSEPVAQIVFAFSAVEMLGQDEDWSTAQKQLLDELAASAQKVGIGSIEEREEIKSAIQRMQKLSLRQGVMRLLTSLNLDHLKKRWDKLYEERSTLVHGLAPKPGVNYSDLAHKSISLCGQILLTAIAKEVPDVSKHINDLYKA